MFQFILLIMSFGYGIFVGLLVFLTKNKFIKLLEFIFMTILYVVIFYFINNGEIHLYNKLMLILGYCFYYYIFYVKLNVKLKKITRKIKKV